MKKTLKTTLTCTMTFLCALLLTTAAFAHSGRTDSNGGHNKRADGTYHYHSGSDRTVEYAAPPGTDTPVTSDPTEPPKPTAPPVSDPQTAAIRVLLDGEAIVFDQPPEMIGSRVLVPVRPVVEKIGCGVEWDPVTETVYITEAGVAAEKNGVKLETINVFVNDTKIAFPDQPPVNINGRVLIPIRYVVEMLGYSVEWDAPARTVVIEKGQAV